MTEKPFPKVSIIIPVFNVRKYLRPCLDSAVGQTLRDIEIICVNDGSTDDSLEVIRSFADKDARVRVIDQPNGGVSSARNAGLAAAQGQYIRFLDGDDILPLDACENSYGLAERDRADVLLCSIDRITEDGRRVDSKRFPDASYDLREIPERKTVFSRYLTTGTPVQFFRRETLRGLRYKPFWPSEDVLFSFEAVVQAKVLSTQKKVGYLYVDREGSGTKKDPRVRFTNHLGVRREMIKILNGLGERAPGGGWVGRKILEWAFIDFFQLEKLAPAPEGGADPLFQEWLSIYREGLLRGGGGFGPAARLALGVLFRPDSPLWYRAMARAAGWGAGIRRFFRRRPD